MLNILSLLIAVSQRCTSYLNPPDVKTEMEKCKCRELSLPLENVSLAEM
jgi:hypothetical protein